MAIKFVDIEPGEAEKPKRAEAPKAKLQAEHEAAKGSVDAEASDDEPALPGLPHAKSTPKARGRKKPLK